MLTFAVETITEELAQQYIDSQVMNRPVSETIVRKYRNEINAGRWVLNGEALKFDSDGHLRDGQHRCRARLGATRDFETLVIRGVSAESQWTMDQGRARKAGQQLAMAGVKNANVVAAGARLYLTYSTGVMFRDSKLASETITTPLIESWVLSNLPLAEEMHSYYAHIRTTDARTSIGYAAAIIFHQISPPMSREFFRIFSTGAGGANHPITVLDKRLQKHRREGIYISPRDTLGLYIQAWNAWLKDRALTKFQRPRGGHWTEATYPHPIAPSASKVRAA